MLPPDHLPHPPNPLHGRRPVVLQLRDGFLASSIIHSMNSDSRSTMKITTCSDRRVDSGTDH